MSGDRGGASANTEPQAVEIPWATTATALTAIFTLGMVAHWLPVILVVPLAVAFMATYITRFRLDNSTPMRWILRVLLIAAAYFTARQANPLMMDYAVGPAWSRNFFGLIYAGEMTLQAWRTRTDNPKAQLAILFGSGIVFTTAANTFEDHLIRLITPVYLALLLTALRGYRSRRAVVPIRSQRTERFAAVTRASALALTLAVGFTGFQLFNVYRGEITDWGNNLLSQRLAQALDSGMADQPVLGRTFGLRGSQERVLRLTGTNGVYAGDPHLRGMSFDTYDKGRWGPAVGERGYITPRDPDMRSRMRPGDPAVGPTNIVRVTRLAHDNTLIYAPISASEIDLTDADNLQWAPASGGPIKTTSAPPFSYTLSVPTGNPQFQGILADRLTPKERERCLNIPQSLEPGVIALARKITHGCVTPQEKIEAITAYLLRTHRYSFTTDPGHGDPVSGFLLSDPPKAAHCEYFGSSSALLLRCVGVPTRYVTGYYVHESEGTDTSVVRQRDAHAWAEAWIDGVGWTTVEATPGDGLPDYKPDPISRWQALTEFLQDLAQSIKDRLGDLKPEQVSLMMAGLTGIVVVGTVIWILVMRRRRRSGDIARSRFAGYSVSSADLVQIAAEFESLQRRWNVPLDESRTWQEHLQQLEGLASLDLSVTGADDPTQRMLTLSRRFVALYERARFGAASVDEPTLGALRALLAEIDAIPAPRSLPANVSKGAPTPVA